MPHPHHTISSLTVAAMDLLSITTLLSINPRTSNPLLLRSTCVLACIGSFTPDVLLLVFPATLIRIPYIFKSKCCCSMENNFSFLKAEKGELFNVTTLKVEQGGPVTPHIQLWLRNMRLGFPERAQLSQPGEVPSSKMVWEKRSPLAGTWPQQES